MNHSVFAQKIRDFITTSRLAIPMLLAAMIGVGTALIAVGFIKLIALANTFFFDDGAQRLGALGPYFVIIIPAIGGLLVGPLVTFVAPEAKGHGVPEVLQAIALRGGRIRPIVVLVKALASVISIGSGSSVGREGPIVQVGSALGSSAAQGLKLSELRTKNFIACGAAAGIASVFNAPIAGVMFSLEVILRDFGARALSTVVIAAVSSSIVSRIFLGDSPAFVAPSYSLWSPFELFIYLGLGVLSALAALAFISTLCRSENAFERWKFPEWLKPAVGGLAIGGIGFYFPQIFGTGLATIEQALHGELALQILLFLVVAKIFATSISLGSGSSGGVFAPALFIGAALGGAVGKLAYHKMPFPVAPPGAYALVGMACVFAAAAHAPVTAILIVFEMTGDYRMILPIMVAVVVATSISQFLRRESIYTIRLKKRGVDTAALEEVRLLGALQVRDAMSIDFVTVPNHLPAKELIERMSQEKDKSFFVVNSQGDLVGAIKPEEMQTILLEERIQAIIANDVASPLPERCFADEPLNEAAKLMLTNHYIQLVVSDPSRPARIVGLLKSEDIFRAYADMTSKRSDLVSRVEQQFYQENGTFSIQFTVFARSPASGKMIKELDLPEGVVLTSIKRRSAILSPKGDTVLKTRDKIWAVMISESKPVFREWLKRYKL